MPTQLITKTKGWIDSHLTPANTLTLTSELFGDIISDSIEKVFANPSIEIDEVSISVADIAVTISGKSTFGGAGSISITVEIKDVDDKYVITILFLEIQTPADIGSSLSAIWERFDLPIFFTGFQISAIEFPPIEQSFSIIAEQDEPLGLAGDKIVIGPSARIKFQVTNLSPTSIDILAVFSAPISIGSFNLRLAGELSTDDAVDSRLTIEPVAPADYPSLGDLVEIFIGAGVQIPDGLTIADLQLGDFFQKDTFTLSMRFNETWTLALGPAGLTVRDISITLVWASDSLTGSLQGFVTIAGFDLRIGSNLQEKLTLCGKLPAIKITSLIESIAGPVFSLPSGFPEIELPDADFSIPPLADPLSFLVRTAAGDYGTGWLLITKIDGEWQAAVVFVLSDAWKFSQLSSLLAPLDRLPISKPMLTLASFSEPELSFPEIDGAILQLALLEGVALNSDLILKGLGLDFVRLLIGQEQLPLLLTVGDSLAETEVRVKIAGSMDILPGVIVFEQFALEIDPDPFAIALAAKARVEIFGEKLPEFNVSVGIEEGTTEIELETLKPWKNPFGISGLTITKLALQMKTSPAPQYAILGEIAVSDKIIMMAAQFTSAAPSMIAGELQGTLSLQEIVRDLVGLSLPGGILDISITDFKVHAVADPMGVTIGGETFEPGLALQGTIGFFGLEAFTKVVVEPDKGVYAHAALSEIINLGGVLIISNAAGDGPAFFTLDTRQAPFLVVSGKVSLLGLAELSVQAVVDTSGFEVAIIEDLGIAHYKLNCRVKSLNDFDASGRFDFGINEKLGPFEVAPGVSLGEIKLNVAFIGKISLSLINDQFNASVTGGFEFQGSNIPIPKIQLSAAPESLEELPQQIVDNIVDNAEDMFADLLQNADKWLLALRDGIIEGVENVARVLKDEFNRSAEQIGKDIRNTLNRGSRAAAQGLKEIGESPEKIAEILKGFGDPRDEVIAALCNAGFGSDRVIDALTGSFPGLNHLDVGLPAVNNTIRVDETVYPRKRIPLHVDETPVPHHDARPHIDHQVWPRWSKELRGNVTLVPHYDKRFHTDFGPSWAHTDKSWHTDTSRVHLDKSIHGDIPRGHGDVSKPVSIPAVRVNVSNHADIPSGHADISHPVNIPAAHADENLAFTGGSHVDHSLAPHQDTRPHLDETVLDRKNFSVHLDETVAPHQDRRIPIEASTPRKNFRLHIDKRIAGQRVNIRGPHLDVPAWHGDNSHHVDIPRAHGDLGGHVDLPRVHADESVHVNIPGSVTHVDIPLCG